MKHKVKVTVIDKKLYPELQQQYCADPDSGSCPCYNVGDEFVFYRNDERDDFWHMGLNTLTKTTSDPDTVAGGPKMPHCSEAWDAISRYIYTGLQGGSIMKDWMKEENTMIACCSDGTRPVIFKIERIDIAENEEEKEWLAKQNFKNTADEIQNCYANKFSKNLVQERHDQRVIIKSYRQCMATAGCFSELGFIYMILLWR